MYIEMMRSDVLFVKMYEFFLGLFGRLKKRKYLCIAFQIKAMGV